jgi:ribosomal protein S12
MYVRPNFKTKKALKEALAAGKEVVVFCPGVGTVPENGRVTIEGPHFPEPHKWYAEGTMKDGKLVSVK